MWKSKKPNDRFEAVHQLMAGQLEPQSSSTSFLFFTVHKAASSFVGRILDQIAKSQNMNSIDFDGYFHAVSETEQDKHIRPNLMAQIESDDLEATPETQSQLQSMFLTHGCYYGPIRRPALLKSIPHLDKFRVVVLLRDPRDCLTSLYFSMAYSHRTPPNKQVQERFEKYREHVRKQNIDNYVLEEAPCWLARYQAYCTALSQHQNVHLVTYEQLVMDFPAWLDRVSSILDVQIPRRTYNKIHRMADFNVDQEDVHSHKRQVQPGDHCRKLTPETIERLNDVLRPALASLEYPVESDSRAA